MTRSERRLILRTFAVGTLLTLLIIAIDRAGWLAQIEQQLYDFRARHFQYFASAPTDLIVHVDIDDPSMKQVGAWPWPRERIAKMIDEIRLAGAKVIAMDVLFAEPQETRYKKQPDGTFVAIEDDDELAKAFTRAGNMLIPNHTEIVPMPKSARPMLLGMDQEPIVAPLAKARKFDCVVNFLPDPDGVVRSMPVFVMVDGKPKPHMAMAAFCAMMDVPVEKVRIEPDRIIVPLPTGKIVEIPVHQVASKTMGNAGTFMDIPWIGKPGSKSWETIYDFPDHADSKQHIPLKNIWAICQMLQDGEKNRREWDEALRGVESAYPSDEIRAFLANPDESKRQRIVDATLKEMSELGDIPNLEKVKESELKQDELKFLASYRTLRAAGADHARLTAKIETARAGMRQQFLGKYALIGWTATGRMDAYPTSIDPLCPGVMVQGLAFNAMATEQFWIRTNIWSGPISTLIVGMFTTAIVALFPIYRAMLFSLVLGFSYLSINGLLFFDYGNRIVPAAGPILASFLIWFGVTTARIIYEQAERRRITSRFSTYVDPAVVDYVVDHPEAMEPQVREMTVVFTDLAGFTSITEKLGDRTVKLLNEYMSIMLPLIRGNGGMLDKFIGDGIMFFFNAPTKVLPDHGAVAVRTVLQMHEVMPAFNQRAHEKGLPEVNMRAGIATGTMVVGDAGSADAEHPAADYTVLGDVVNLGARLEGANKVVGTRTLISGRTAELADGKFLMRPIGTLRVKGKNEGVPTFEVICPMDQATEQQQTISRLSSQVVEHFQAARFERCIETALELEKSIGVSKFTGLYLKMARQYQSSPPEGTFDGQIVLDEK